MAEPRRNIRSPHYAWLIGNEKKKVHCPDGEVRELTFPEYIQWQREWSEKGSS